jgi:formylmethanofuran dehydrogenase subunit E
MAEGIFPEVKVFNVNCNACGCLDSTNRALIHQMRVFCSRCVLELVERVSSLGIATAVES